MERVTTREGVGYGLSILGYVVSTVVASGVTVWIGLELVGASTLVGAGLALAGLVVGVAGLAGLQFKIIADAVAAGLVIHDDDTAP